MFTNLIKMKFVKFGKHNQFPITSYHHISPRGDMLAESALILDPKFYNKISSFYVNPLPELARVEVSMSPVSGRTECLAQK